MDKYLLVYAILKNFISYASDDKAEKRNNLWELPIVRNLMKVLPIYGFKSQLRDKLSVYLFSKEMAPRRRSIKINHTKLKPLSLQ